MLACWEQGSEKYLFTLLIIQTKKKKACEVFSFAQNKRGHSHGSQMPPSPEQRLGLQYLSLSQDQRSLLYFHFTTQLSMTVSTLLRLALWEQPREWCASSFVIVFMKRKKKEGNSPVWHFCSAKTECLLTSRDKSQDDQISCPKKKEGCSSMFRAVFPYIWARVGNCGCTSLKTRTFNFRLSPLKTYAAKQPHWSWSS